MSGNRSKSQRKQGYLSTGQAAKRMGVSRRTVRDLCRRGRLSGAFQEYDNGPWRIPTDAVTAWLELHNPSTSGPPTRRKCLRSVIEISAAVVGLLTIISILADLGGARQQLQEWGLIRVFRPERQGEILIVVASFYHSEGIPDTEVHNEIRQAIDGAAEELGFTHLRVEVEHRRILADDRVAAEKLGKRYNASMIIWGADTGVRVTVSFLNLRQPRADAAEVQISEAERTQFADPEAYSTFVVEDLPSQLAFLSLFAIGQSYEIEGLYADGIKVIEKAIGTLASVARPPDGLAAAYFHLGSLYGKLPMSDYGQAIANYTQAIELNPKHAGAYNSRGTARARQGDLGGAIADYDQAIRLDPDGALAYQNRGVARDDLGDLDGAIADYDKAIALDPKLAVAYYNRGNARLHQGDLDAAIADYTRAIEINPLYISVYGNRGIARRDHGDLEGAIADFSQVITLDPDSALAYSHRGSAHWAQGNLDAAIADYTRAIKLDPSDASAYCNRGLLYSEQGYWGAAITDFDRAIALDPNSADSYWGLGVVYDESGNAEAAVVNFRHYLELRPEAWDRDEIRKRVAELEAQIPGP